MAFVTPLVSGVSGCWLYFEYLPVRQTCIAAARSALPQTRTTTTQGTLPPVTMGHARYFMSVELLRMCLGVNAGHLDHCQPWNTSSAAA